MPTLLKSRMTIKTILSNKLFRRKTNKTAAYIGLQQVGLKE